MSSSYENENIEYTDNLSRPLTAKGSVFVNGGSSKFELISPSSNGDVLVSNSSTVSGTEWIPAATSGTGFGLSTRSVNNLDVPGVGNDMYFLSLGRTDPSTIALPDCSWLLFLITPRRKDDSIDGWSDIPTNITGGSLDFYFGYVEPNLPNIVSNFKYYATGTTTVPASPDFQIMGIDINTAATTYRAFRYSLNYSVTNGHQVCIRFVNNLTQSSSPSYNSFQALNLFRTT